MTEMHLKRARAYASIAKAQVRQAQAAPSSSASSKSADASDTSAVYAEDYLQRAQASWRKCLSDSTSVLYYDNVSSDGVAGVLLKVRFTSWVDPPAYGPYLTPPRPRAAKADALVGLDRFDECISEVCARAHLPVLSCRDALGSGSDLSTCLVPTCSWSSTCRLSRARAWTWTTSRRRLTRPSCCSRRANARYAKRSAAAAERKLTCIAPVCCRWEQDLYAVMGVIKGSHATPAEIKSAYKKAALKWHPDRHSGSTEEKKKEAEAKFKEIGDAFELLTDPVKKKLYDQGYVYCISSFLRFSRTCLNLTVPRRYDRDEIDQRAEYEKQGGGHRGYGGHHGGFGGGGFGGGFY